MSGGAQSKFASDIYTDYDVLYEALLTNYTVVATYYLEWMFINLHQCWYTMSRESWHRTELLDILSQRYLHI